MRTLKHANFIEFTDRELQLILLGLHALERIYDKRGRKADSDEVLLLSEAIKPIAVLYQE